MDIVKLAVMFIGAMVLFTIAPFALIWAVNTLFSLSIAYTLLNWLAALILLSVFNAK